MMLLNRSDSLLSLLFLQKQLFRGFSGKKIPLKISGKLCFANQYTGFYMIGTSAMKKLIELSRAGFYYLDPLYIAVFLSGSYNIPLVSLMQPSFSKSDFHKIIHVS